MSASAPEEIAGGLWRWTARHSEWHPGEFGAQVASFALRAGDDALLVDPLLPDGEQDAGPASAVLATLDALVARADRVAILITIPYHARSAEALWRRYRERAPTTIHGHAAVAKRLRDDRGLQVIELGAELPGGAVAYPIGRPRRHEAPLHLPSHDAIAFGDAVVEHGGRLRMWALERVDERRAQFYARRFAPTLAPLLELAPERILVTHGAAILAGGRAALARALGDPPWYHRG